VPAKLFEFKINASELAFVFKVGASELAPTP
jgi:hypothetical protein